MYKSINKLNLLHAQGSWVNIEYVGIFASKRLVFLHVDISLFPDFKISELMQKKIGYEMISTHVKAC